MAPTNGMIAGMYSAWGAFRNNAGYPVGNNPTPNSPTVNTVYGAHRLKYPVRIGRPNISRVRATRRGGQRVRGSRFLGISDLGAFPLVLDGFDEQWDAYVRKTAVDSAYNTAMTMTAGNMGLVTPPRFVLGLCYGFTDTDNGVDYIDTTIWNNVYFEPPEGDQSSQDGGENPNPLEWSVVPDLSARMGFGALYSASGLSVIENTDAYVRIRSQYELYLASYIANGSATTFTLPYLPLDDDETGAAGNIILKNGVITAVTSVNTSSGLVTLTAAGSSGDHWDILYPTAYRVAA